MKKTRSMEEQIAFAGDVTLTEYSRWGGDETSFCTSQVADFPQHAIFS
jgi:hypothetical protein